MTKITESAIEKFAIELLEKQDNQVFGKDYFADMPDSLLRS